jgi:nicotinic acid phosphoribosyltransferase
VTVQQNHNQIKPNTDNSDILVLEQLNFLHSRFLRWMQDKEKRGNVESPLAHHLKSPESNVIKG